jgi:hypothetical protein
LREKQWRKRIENMTLRKILGLKWGGGKNEFEKTA